MASLGLCFLVLLAGPGRLAAHDSASRLFLASADKGGPASATASLTFPVYRLLPEESQDGLRGHRDGGTAEAWAGPPATDRDAAHVRRRPLVTGHRTG